jgi:hypothetical protein
MAKIPKIREPRGSDLMSARDIAESYGLPLRTVENMRDAIARAHGGPIVPTGPDGKPLVRRIFVRREGVEASIGK